MDVGEATRQYQVALEHRRRCRPLFEGSLSCQDELAGLDADVDDALAQLHEAWASDAVSRALAGYEQYHPTTTDSP